jgi:DNA-binding NarL/FixJ family response regulator
MTSVPSQVTAWAQAATAYLAAGYRDAGHRAAARCHELHAEGEGGIEPEIEGLDPGATALTSRERQLVEIAARGLSNVGIADRLVLSVRTVESHLYRRCTSSASPPTAESCRPGQRRLSRLTC